MSSKRLFITILAASLIAVPAMAQTLQRAPNRVQAPTKDYSQPDPETGGLLPMVPSQGEMQPAGPQTMDGMRFTPPKLDNRIVACAAASVTRFAYRFYCFDNLESENRSHRYWTFIIRRDGSQPPYALKAEDFPTVRDMMFNGETGRTYQLYTGDTYKQAVVFFEKDTKPAAARYCDLHHPFARSNIRENCRDIVSITFGTPLMEND